MTIFYILLGLIIFCVVALLLTPNLFRPSPEAQRVFDVTQSDSARPDQRTIGGKEQLQARLMGAATGAAHAPGPGGESQVAGAHDQRAGLECRRCIRTSSLHRSFWPR